MTNCYVNERKVSSSFSSSFICCYFHLSSANFLLCRPKGHGVVCGPPPSSPESDPGKETAVNVRISSTSSSGSEYSLQEMDFLSESQPRVRFAVNRCPKGILRMRRQRLARMCPSVCRSCRKKLSSVDFSAPTFRRPGHYHKIPKRN